MLQAICKKILYGWMGFREDVTEDIPAKFIICLAPHTSNWDFLMGQLYSQAAGFHCNFMMKKEWFFWPEKRILLHRAESRNPYTTLWT